MSERSYHQFYPVGGCPLEKNNTPCGLQGKDSEGTYWGVNITVPTDSTVASLVDGRPQFLDYTTRGPDGPRPLSKNLIQEVQAGNASCAMCGQQVQVNTKSVHVDEPQSLDSAVESFFDRVDEEMEAGRSRRLRHKGRREGYRREKDDEVRTLDEILNG
jgi:hypothetical protein